MSDLPAAGTVLCALGDLDATGAKGLNLGGTGIFVVRSGDDVFGYINSCPHIGVPLDMEPDEFISDFGDEIICSTHGARFRIEDGECVSGPCAGDMLEPVAVKIKDDQVILA
ncbi:MULTISPECIES: Rieske (2Fe-2S) protein [Thalassospira]|jgi:nitrite reductase/ring-hydroxylating ferredoxin subunit|uniref:(2Fe-2S)-binding protein n=1 Tax=Thalassospira profundimaris TaxID=502049 RepID=A0A367VGK8_9PROT|nr:MULTISPECIES: Rieske (2Fe-2S) protein [Thalassospira]KZB71351.1 (2Fe-2S)-binding protein [Thalassospira sp. MCCC 1A01148]MBS8275111.1 Rieske (2Fe-2S) protein [Thalassospira tepidiphila]RCK24336.1 (2Fe-2S)-binding protein [Thalassospira profundimaris]